MYLSRALQVDGQARYHSRVNTTLQEEAGRQAAGAEARDDAAGRNGPPTPRQRASEL